MTRPATAGSARPAHAIMGMPRRTRTTATGILVAPIRIDLPRHSIQAPRSSIPRFRPKADADSLRRLRIRSRPLPRTFGTDPVADSTRPPRTPRPRRPPPRKPAAPASPAGDSSQRHRRAIIPAQLTARRCPPVGNCAPRQAPDPVGIKCDPSPYLVLQHAAARWYLRWRSPRTVSVLECGSKQDGARPGLARKPKRSHQRVYPLHCWMAQTTARCSLRMHGTGRPMPR
jgi:hypothetical protein